MPAELELKIKQKTLKLVFLIPVVPEGRFKSRRVASKNRENIPVIPEAGQKVQPTDTDVVRREEKGD